MPKRFISKETRRKISKAHKGMKHTVETRKKLSEIHRKSENILKSIENLPKNRRGKECYQWKGGMSRGYKTGYWSKEYLLWRKSVFERDEYTCQVCRKVGIYLTAHHIKSWAYYPKLRFKLSNGITLCEACHSLTDNYKGRAKSQKHRTTKST